MNKGITFVFNTEQSQCDKEENLSNNIDLLSKRFNNPLKYLNRKWKTKGHTSAPGTKAQLKTNPMMIRVLSALNVKTIAPLDQNALTS